MRKELRSYGRRIAELSAGTRPNRTAIGYTLTDDIVTFTRISDTGRRLIVELEDGRITRQNLGELARVW